MKPAKIDVPVLITFFVRPETLEKVFDSVRTARPTVLLLWQDGPRCNRPDDIVNINKCRDIVEHIDWECKVYKKDEDISLSKIEYQLLLYLAEHKNQVLSKEQLLTYVWDNQGRFVDENTLSVNIRRLRTKLEDDPKHPERIRTVHGIGYIWKEEAL